MRLNTEEAIEELRELREGGYSDAELITVALLSVGNELEELAQRLAGTVNENDLGALVQIHDALAHLCKYGMPSNG